MNPVPFYVPYLLTPGDDFQHSKVRLRLSVAPALALVLLGLVVESVDLLCLALSNDFCLDFGALHKRGAGL